MLFVIGSTDRYLSGNLQNLVKEAGHRSIRTNKVERIIRELKQPERAALIDVNWEDIQEHGQLKQLVNLSRICGNMVICICPNTEEDLKKLAKASRADAVFLRYDLATAFKDYLSTI